MIDGRPAEQQRPAVEPPGVKARHDRQERLQDPHPAEQLQVDRVLPVHAEHEQQCAELHDQRRDLRDARLVAGVAFGADELAVDVAGEQVRRGDRHDRRRDERADARWRRRPRRRTSSGRPGRRSAARRVARSACRPGRSPTSSCRSPRSRAAPAGRACSEYVGRIAALRRITLRLLPDSTAVIECGYMNSASADPKASVPYAQYVASVGTNTPVGAPVVGRRRLHLRLRRVEHVAEADLHGDVDDRHDDHDVDQRVLDERDQRRRAQAGGVGVRGQHRERDDQRQVAHERRCPCRPGPSCPGRPGCRRAAARCRASSRGCR